MKLTGINTAIITNVIEINAPEISFIASMAATLALFAPSSSLAWTASTTTMASSTTMAMARTKAQRVRRFILKPINFRTKKVPINATGIAIAGIRVERKSCKKIYTTKNTRIKASIKVFNTSWIDANKKSLVLSNTSYTIPGGKSSDSLLSNSVISLMI